PTVRTSGPPVSISQAAWMAVAVEDGGGVIMTADHEGLYYGWPPRTAAWPLRWSAAAGQARAARRDPLAKHPQKELSKRLLAPEIEERRRPLSPALRGTGNYCSPGHRARR
ncbi:MAG TPA: hypothetical protein VED59_08670, partial [Acidimicrobiales bacterium]|nr:hypothetical protein [Acidimicrobiales bacterium]